MKTEGDWFQNDKSRRVNDLQRLLIWCGEGDLNPDPQLITRKLLKSR
jgi:hypothetical protein